MLQFAEILPFVQQRLQEAGSKAATLVKQIEAMLNDVQSNCFLQVKLAAVVDAGKPMV